MAKSAPGPSVITANRLHDGAVVYLDAHGAWSERISDAAPAQGDALGNLQNIAAQAVVQNVVVDVAAIGIDLSLRERIRLKGPTVRPDLGRKV